LISQATGSVGSSRFKQAEKIAPDGGGSAFAIVENKQS
jgi:hypothetical protein